MRPVVTASAGDSVGVVHIFDTRPIVRGSLKRYTLCIGLNFPSLNFRGVNFGGLSRFSASEFSGSEVCYFLVCVFQTPNVIVKKSKMRHLPA